MCPCDAATGYVCAVCGGRIKRALERLRYRRGTFGAGYEEGLQSLRELYGPARVDAVADVEAADR